MSRRLLLELVHGAASLLAGAGALLAVVRAAAHVAVSVAFCHVREVPNPPEALFWRRDGCSLGPPQSWVHTELWAAWLWLALALVAGASAFALAALGESGSRRGQP